MSVTLFSQFLKENNIAEITFDVDKNSPIDMNILVDEIKETLLNFGVKLNEDIGKTGDYKIGYGVKGKLKARGQEEGKIINPNVDITKDDRKVLSDIEGKITRGLQMFGDLAQFLESYDKINPKPIVTIISQLKSFQEAIKNEIANMPV